jgi:putative addiction module CopG family antidote
MAISLTPDQEEFVRRAIGAGRFDRADDVAKEALSLWEERERGRAESLATLDAADASSAGDEGISITQGSMRALAEDVKQGGRDRLAAERQKTG